MHRHQGTKEAQRLAEAFGQLLARQRHAADTAGPEQLRGMADVLCVLGTAAGDHEKPGLEAQGYLQQAAEMYGAILASHPATVPPDTLDAVHVRLVRTLRRLDLLQLAADEAEKLLAVRPGLMEAQVEAALVYQTWGQQEPAYYRQALAGPAGGAGEASHVWGWEKIAAALAPLAAGAGAPAADPRPAAFFREACYNRTLCRGLYAAHLSGPQREAAFRQMADDLRQLEPLCLAGGPRWTARYNQLSQRLHDLRSPPPDAPPPGKPEAEASRTVKPDHQDSPAVKARSSL